MTWPFGDLEPGKYAALLVDPRGQSLPLDLPEVEKKLPRPQTPQQIAVSHRAIEIGTAGEHLVCADLLLKGYRAFLTGQGLPYDVAVDVEGRLIRVQVRSTIFARNVNSKGRSVKYAYSFAVRKRGKGGHRRLSNDECDIIALVALDIRIVAYIALFHAAATVQLTPPGTEGYRLSIDSLPFESAVNASPKFCIRGHQIKGITCHICRVATGVSGGGRPRRRPR